MGSSLPSDLVAFLICSSCFCTSDRNKERGEDLEQVRKDLQELIELQKRLQEDTESGKPVELTA